MNTSGRVAFQVGLLVVAAIVLAIGAFIFFNGLSRKADMYDLTVLFNDAQGISKQDTVYMAGVKIGEVSRVGLTSDSRRAEVHLDIDKKRRIPVGSAFTIAASLLGGAASVNIVPPAPALGAEPQRLFIPPKSTIVGEDALNFAALQTQAGGLIGQFSQTAKTANGLLTKLTKTVDSLNGTLTDPRLRNSLNGTVQNLDAASEQGLELTRDLRTTLAADNAGFQTSIGNINATTGTIRDAAQENRAQLSEIVKNLNATTSQLAAMSTQANETLTRNHTVQNLADTVSNMKDAVSKLNGIENNIVQLTGDKQIQADLKQTVHNAAAASDNARILVGRLDALTGGIPHPGQKGQLTFISKLNFTENFRTDKFRTDFNIYAPLSTTDFARVGIYDLTESDKFNLQYGQTSPYNKLFTYRAGVYASKVGIGADYDLFGNRAFSVDLYNPNRLQLDARQQFPLNKQSSLYLGLDDVPRTNAITLGFELQR